MQHKIFLMVATMIAATGFLISVPRVVRAANLYAQYADDTVVGQGVYGMYAPYEILQPSGTYHMQVELNITDDEQRGTSFYCPVAPNTGIVLYVYFNGNFVYYHCITSAEAAGKLGHKALYTFDFDSPEFGSLGYAFGFQAVAPFNAQVYGTNINGTFYPYLLMADAGGIGSPSLINTMAQYSVGETAVLPENGITDGTALRFEGKVSSFFASDTLAMQVEVEPSGTAFTGKPTATSVVVPSGVIASTTVGGLAPGAYHWAARAVDAVNGLASAWTEYRVPGNIDFNVPFVREPVVVIPGVMGSVLSRDSDGVEVWPNVGKMALSGSDDYLNDLKLTSTGGATTAITVGDIVRSELGVAFYAPLLQALADDGYEASSTLFMAPYDWRLGVASSAEAIAPVLARAIANSPDGKINVIAHSEGGLLIKEYLRTHDASSIDNLVLAGVPQLGAPLAFKLLNYGDDLGMDWFGLGLNANEAKAITQNMQGVYDLLPSRRYVSVNGGYVEDFRNGANKLLGFDDTNALMLASTSDSRNAGMINAADAFHGALDGTAVQAAHVYNILGCGMPTVTGFDLYDKGVVKLRTDAGDGTVPEASAMNLANGFKNYFTLGDETGIDHVGLVTNAKTIGLITGILDGASSSLLPQGISASLSDCVNPPAAPLGSGTTIAFSTHSPVALNVYDASGYHTGPTDQNGDFETAISGSRYETIGENTFIFVPGGADYNVTDIGLASGTFEMQIQEYDAGKVAQEANYISVPLQGGSTTAKLNFSGFNGDMNLALDENGDGVTDATIAPNAITDAAIAGDSVPPTITMPTIPSSVIQNTTTTLAWNVTDDNSGVATSSATLNGVAVANGSIVPLATLGQNVFIVTAFDKAGNPRVTEIDFTVVPPILPSPSPSPSPTPTPSSTPTPVPSPTPTPISSSTFISTIAADTYVTPLAPNKNFGDAKRLSLGDFDANRILISVSADTMHRLTANSSTIVSARLMLTLRENKKGWIENIWDRLFGWRKNARGVLDLFRMTAPWQENGATWNCGDDVNAGNRKANCRGTAWNMAGHSPPYLSVASASTTMTDATNGTISFNVTADVEAMIHGTVPNDGWLLVRDARSFGGGVDFFSREANHGPELVVTYASK